MTWLTVDTINLAVYTGLASGLLVAFLVWVIAVFFDSKRG